MGCSQSPVQTPRSRLVKSLSGGICFSRFDGNGCQTTSFSTPLRADHVSKYVYLQPFGRDTCNKKDSKDNALSSIKGGRLCTFELETLANAWEWPDTMCTQPIKGVHRTCMIMCWLLQPLACIRSPVEDQAIARYLVGSLLSGPCWASLSVPVSSDG